MNLKLLVGISIVAVSSAFVKAETLLVDSFEYPVGSLYGNGRWVEYGKKTAAPIQLVAGSLLFEGYQATEKGCMVELTNATGGESVQYLFRDKGAEPVGGSVYYSALINLKSQPTSSKSMAFFCLSGANEFDPEQFGDKEAGSEGGGLFAQSSGDGFKLGISRNVLAAGNTKANIAWSDSEYQLNTTYLVVLKYEVVEGDNNDKLSLWVNPLVSTTDADATVVANEGSDIDESLANIRGVELRQNSSMVAKVPNVEIDEVRVATSWDEIFNPSGSVQQEAEITLSEATIDFGKAYQGLSYTRTINVKAKNLPGDIQISGMESGCVSTNGIVSISKEQAESEAGCDIEIALSPNSAATTSDEVIFTSGDAQPKKLSVQWRCIETVAVSSIKELYDEENVSMSTLYRFTGEATVTCIDPGFFTFYAQDATAGAEFRSASGIGYDEIDLSGLKQGDNLTDIVGFVIFGDDGGIDIIPAEKDSWRVVSHGNSVAPKEMTFEQIYQAEAWEVMFSLMKVKDVVFDEKYANYPDPDYYGKFNVPFHLVADPTRGGRIWYFHDTDIYGSSTEGYFGNTWAVTGICYQTSPSVAVAPRALSDFEFLKSGGVATNLGEKPTVKAAFDTMGRKVDNIDRQGIYILQMTDGTVRKIAIGY